MNAPTLLAWLILFQPLPGAAASLPPSLQPVPAAPVPPPDWRIELLAAAPQIRHPSVVCSAPDGRIFVAEDPMDISAPAHAAQGRIVCLWPGGRQTVFATNLYAVFGLQYLEGKVYVLHNPRFSVFTDAQGVAIERADLIESTHPKPWALDWNDHVPANFKLAMDGYFYLAVGDKGLYGAVGRDGKRLDLHGGGILRLRPDATDLEVYSSGVRNILDVALTAEDEIFTYDNTDEHHWMGRLTHMVEAGYYGYPYDFVPRRPYTLWMMADFGAGAATGAFAYTEDAWPAEYHDNLFLADFGKRQILRVRMARAGASWRVVSMEEMFRDPPEDFRPVGLALSADGASIYICDWAHRDTKENVEVGRLWKMTYTGGSHAAAKPRWYLPAASGERCEAPTAGLVEALSHPSRQVRLTAQRQLERRIAADARLAAEVHSCVTNTAMAGRARWHALWVLHSAGETSAVLAAARDSDPSLRRQAVRALSMGGSPQAGSALRNALTDQDAAVRFGAATGLGRMGQAADVEPLLAQLSDADDFARYAAFTALNRIGKRSPAVWPRIVKALDDASIRQPASFALRGAFQLELVTALESMARDKGRSRETRAAALRSVIELHHQPAPWKGEWWAYHPALQPPPPRTNRWAGTEHISQLLREMLRDLEPRLRGLAVEALGAVRDQQGFVLMRELYDGEPDPSVRHAIVGNIARSEREPALAFLEGVLAAAAQGSDGELVGGRDAAAAVRDGELQKRAITAAGDLKATNLVPKLARFLASKEAPVQLAAVRALGQIGGPQANAALRPVLREGSGEVRAEAIKALGRLRDTNSVPALLEAWKASETRTIALEALARMPDLRALEAYLAGLASANPTVRELCRKALMPIREAALPKILERLPQIEATAIRELRSGGILAPDHLSLPAAPADYEAYAMQNTGNPAAGEKLFFDENGLACSRCHSALGKGKTIGPDLTQVGTQFSRATLIEHILYPSKAVREGYAQTIVETTEGDTLSGLLQTETADSLTLLDAGGAVHTVPKSAVAKRTTSSFSLMPEGLHAGLSVRQFADLIAYLESLKGPASRGP